VFSDAFFFIGGFYFKPINKSCNNMSSFMALAYQVYQLLSNTELRARVDSDFDHSEKSTGR
jgi:hypothetical protein